MAPTKRASSRPTVLCCALQLVREGPLRDAQVGGLEVLGRQPRVLVHLPGHRLALGIRDRIALQQRRRERTGGVGAHLGEERLERRRLSGEHVVVPGHGGVRGEVYGVGPVVARELREDRLDVGRDGDEYQPVEREGALAQVVDDGRPAGGAVALAQQVFWRRPAIVVAHVLHDEAAHGVDVRVDPEELIVLVVADRVGESRPDRIDHHEIAPVEDAEFVVHGPIGSRRSRTRIGDHHPLRSEHAHVQPERRRARSAVEREHERPHAAFGVVPHVRDIADARDRLVLVVADDEGAGGGGVVEGPAADGEVMLGDRALRFR